ncbi:hypothetical protein AVEN_166839-1 [Araneus ventricosus]|uniref:Uncharacterized protein n=1 Tax=Araneus ventricosus TaxID=182803 RepID=A0A4Y2H9D0_ARAVE|nr:hypothetical protein AVEN_166839-1 [Araneus ventricosus]
MKSSMLFCCVPRHTKIGLNLSFKTPVFDISKLPGFLSLQLRSQKKIMVLLLRIFPPLASSRFVNHALIGQSEKKECRFVHVKYVPASNPAKRRKTPANLHINWVDIASATQ